MIWIATLWNYSTRRNLVPPYSVVSRLFERSARPKELKQAMQQWCQKANPAIEDLDCLAPYLFGMKCYDIDCCTVCDAVNGLKARSKRFLGFKIEHDAAEKAHADAIEHHKKLIEHCSSRKGRALKAHKGRVSHQARRVSVAAALVLNDARSASSAADSVADNATMVLKAAVRLADRHNHVQSLLQALRAVCGQPNCTK